MKRPARQAGLTYVEVLVAAVLIAVALVPALQSLHSGTLGAEIHTSAVEQHYAVLARIEDVLAEPYSMLTAAAGTAGDFQTPTAYSDAAGTEDRVVVYIALYDANDDDNDGDVFTVPDLNVDGDNNPFTGYSGPLWVRAEVEGSVAGLETLTAP